MLLPKVFISYSWEDDEHKQWVRQFADRLLSDGVNVTIDQYDLELGDRLPQFMEQSITNSDYVLVICTPTYKNKSDNRTGGVGYEGHIISGELFTKEAERKFIPIIRKGTAYTAIPVCMMGKLGIDLTDGTHYDDNYNDLITTLYGTRRKPQIGSRPAHIKAQSTHVADKKHEEPIHILGIIANEVTVPKMDGTRGSALYKIPFRLSKTPSNLWEKFFLSSWQCPPIFSTMHRPGIASVLGDKIILNGTTIEEVRDFHRETLVLCVNEANKMESEILKKEQIRKEREEAQKAKHFNNVRNVIDEIKF